MYSRRDGPTATQDQNKPEIQWFQQVTARGGLRMALFERENDKFRPDLSSQALSVIAVENDFVEGVYDKLAKVYDVLFGPILHPGRLLALERMGIAPGDRVLEVGVGTGINAALYPRHCQVTGIDFSASMLEKARERVSRKGLPHVRLMEMDAAAPQVRRRVVRHRLRAVSRELRLRSA